MEKQRKTIIIRRCSPAWMTGDEPKIMNQIPLYDQYGDPIETIEEWSVYVTLEGICKALVYKAFEILRELPVIPDSESSRHIEGGRCTVKQETDHLANKIKVELVLTFAEGEGGE